MLHFPKLPHQQDNVSILPTPHSTLYFDVGIPQFLEFVWVLLKRSLHPKFEVNPAKYEKDLTHFFLASLYGTHFGFAMTLGDPIGRPPFQKKNCYDKHKI